ncbi:MAG: hypothetical protein KGI37_01680 [Alphaproteobacteria bacterium]|nr:hypothetical protein [Alphaproteobacteria bacterium]
MLGYITRPTQMLRQYFAKAAESIVECKSVAPFEHRMRMVQRRCDAHIPPRGCHFVPFSSFIHNAQFYLDMSDKFKPKTATEEAKNIARRFEKLHWAYTQALNAQIEGLAEYETAIKRHRHFPRSWRHTQITRTTGLARTAKACINDCVRRQIDLDETAVDLLDVILDIIPQANRVYYRGALNLLKQLRKPFYEDAEDFLSGEMSPNSRSADLSARRPNARRQTSLVSRASRQ